MQKEWSHPRRRSHVPMLVLTSGDFPDFPPYFYEIPSHVEILLFLKSSFFCCSDPFFREIPLIHAM